MRNFLIKAVDCLLTDNLGNSKINFLVSVKFLAVKVRRDFRHIVESFQDFIDSNIIFCRHFKNAVFRHQWQMSLYEFPGMCKQGIFFIHFVQRDYKLILMRFQNFCNHPLFFSAISC